jgi:predicted Fe-Mo cluster-binding NifX family protein
MTRVCVPTSGTGGLDDLVGEHFGRVPTYTVFDTETQAVEIVDNSSEHMGGRGYPAEILARTGIDVLLCSGLGRRAIQMLSSDGIAVCTGASGTAREAIACWRGGDLAAASEGDACTRHVFHDHH